MKLGRWWLAGLLTLVTSTSLADGPPTRRGGAKPPWPVRIPAPPGGWLVEHHDRIKRMRPRVLLINFSNEHSAEELQRLAMRIIRCVAEGSRYHGYADGRAPVFLEYQVFKLVDLRDPGGARGG